MPGIMPVYKADDRTLNELCNKELVDRQTAINKAWKYYDGEQPQFLIGGENLLINLSERAVDKTVEFIGIPEQAQLPKDDGTASSAAQDELDRLWDTYRTLTPEIVQSGLIAGHNFLKLYFDPDEKAAMTLLDPKYMAVCWHTTNVRQPLFYRMVWEQGGEKYIQDIVPDWLLNPTEETALLVVPPPAQSWMIMDYVKKGAGKMRLLREQAWDFPFAPIVDWPNKRRAHAYYGMSLLRSGVMGLNDGVNEVGSNTRKIIKHHAHPKTFVFGASLENESAVEGYWDDLPSEARVENMELRGDLASSMNFLNLLKSEFFASTRVLDLATVQDKLGQITNFGVRMLFSDMIEAREETTALYGAGIAEALRRMAVMDGATLDKPPQMIWADPIPVNRLEQLKAAETEAKLGTTSKKTLADDIGRNYETETQQMALETRTDGAALLEVMRRGGERGIFG